MKYRKKPVVIDAWQWSGSHGTDDPEWVWENAVYGDGCLDIKTLEGTMTAQPGDWIIKGVKGEVYPCKPDIFDMTYEKATDSEVS